jgi:hypothetical protein
MLVAELIYAGRHLEFKSLAFAPDADFRGVKMAVKRGFVANTIVKSGGGA